MKRLIKILAISLLVFTGGCTQHSEVSFPDRNSIPLHDEPVTFNLKYNQEVVLDGKYILKFEGVGADSRCPVDVTCVWSGDGEVFLKLSASDYSQRVTLHTTLDPREIVFDNCKFQLLNLFPAARSDRRISKEDYNINLKVTKL